jgi:transcriptional regulator with XRE-family HTH domain
VRFPDFARQVAANLRAARERAELTQEELAHQARVNARHYQRLEVGLHAPSLEILYRCAYALRTSVAALVEVPPDEWANAELPLKPERPRRRRRRVQSPPKND